MKANGETAATICETLGIVVGGNARALRRGAGVTAERFAHAATAVGLPWTTGRVGDFEHGRIPPNLDTIYAAAAALGRLIGRPVTLPELLATDEPVAVNDALTIDPAALLGEVVRVRGRFGGEGALAATAVPVLETDVRLLRDIGVDRKPGVDAMVRLWGRPFSAERDRRAGPDANAQRRGIVARRLKAELQKALTDGND